MNSKIRYHEKLTAAVERTLKPSDGVNYQGKYMLQHVRAGVVIAEYEFKNTVVNEGKNLTLDVSFGSTSKPTWYMGLMDNTGGGGSTSSGDTMTSHAGWNEFTTYSEGTRQAWGAGAAASQSITNSTPVAFSITGSATIVGGFITTNSTKGGTSGTLWSAGNFSSIAVISGDTLRLTYTLTVS